MSRDRLLSMVDLRRGLWGQVPRNNSSAIVALEMYMRSGILDGDRGTRISPELRDRLEALLAVDRPPPHGSRMSGPRYGT
jgi:hypothetical protein